MRFAGRLGFATGLLAAATIADADPRIQVPYPPVALLRGEEGTVSFTVEVNEQGRVDSCVVTESSGSEALDQDACDELLHYARFTPAKDAQGKPRRGKYSSRIHYHLPH
jgi:periplasmic protein TonB